MRLATYMRKGRLLIADQGDPSNVQNVHCEHCDSAARLPACLGDYIPYHVVRVQRWIYMCDNSAQSGAVSFVEREDDVT